MLKNINLKTVFSGWLMMTIAIYLIGCNDDTGLPKDQFDKVEIGMTQPEVKQILGEPFEMKIILPDSFPTYFYRVRHGRGDLRNAEVQFDKKGYVRFVSAGLQS
ncbi:MAG: outer membrane protein assembly factor BamE [Bacteroidetes bacterium]|nr:outer membrane protein assembly factor BamE [Bacteroidota bacterium]